MWSSYKGWNGVVCPVVMCLREHNHNRPRMRTTEREQLKVISLTCFLSRHYRTGYQNNCSSNTTVRKRKPRIWFSRWKELSGYRLLFLRVLTKAHHTSHINDNALCFSAFYTARYGFKVCMRLYLNGDGVGKGTHISLFFVIMRGEYDPILSWPFRHKVKRYNQAVNQWSNQSFSEHLCCS